MSVIMVSITVYKVGKIILQYKNPQAKCLKETI